MRAPLPQLFGEVVESISTRDEPFTDSDGGFGTRIVRPDGRGWRVTDYRHDKRTRWTRRRPVIIPIAQKAGRGGWWRR